MKVISLIASAFLLTSCFPAVIGSGATVVTSAAKEKGVTGTWSDSQISVALKAKIYNYDRDAHRRVGINVQNGEVLLTGTLPNQEQVDKVEQLAWQVQGVKRVINHVGVTTDDGLNIKEGSKDSWITTQIKTNLLFEGDIKSINYSIKTVSSIVHVMGIAQNQAELDKVLKIARNTKGVKKVVSYVQIKENAGSPDAGSDIQDEPAEEPAEAIAQDAE